MLRWMCDRTTIDRARNKYSRDNLAVTSIENKMRKNHLRLFNQVYRRRTDSSKEK